MISVAAGRRVARPLRCGMSDEEGAVLWIVYMLECADKTLYTGITSNLDRRMAEHAAGKGARYTRGRGPFRLVYRETCQNRAEASRCETAIKLLDRTKKRQLCMVSSMGRMPCSQASCRASRAARMWRRMRQRCWNASTIPFIGLVTILRGSGKSKGR